MKNKTEPQLVTVANSAAAGREPAAYFWELWEQYKPDLYNICLKKMSGGVGEAEDALGTAMLLAYEKFPQNVSKIYNLRGWLMRLTSNVCIDILRKQKCEYTYKERVAKSIKSNGFSDSATQPASIEDSSYREELIRNFYHSIKKLPHNLSEPAILRFFLKMPYQDIALRLNLSAANARKRLQMVRTILFDRSEPANNNHASMLLFGNTTGYADLSPTWLKAVKEGKRILNRKPQEIDGTYSAGNMVTVELPSGAAKSTYLFFNGAKTRETTLRNYVNNYPGGWKKRLELAELLYASGKWEEAISEYRLVLEKCPQSLEAWLKLGDMLRNLEQEDEAVKAFESAIPFASQEATRYHIKGMIELCRHRVAPAVTAFSTAASMQKSNGAHQQQLGMSYITVGRSYEAIKAFDKALKINPDDLYSLTHSYDPLVKTGQWNRVEKYVDRVLEVFPNDFLAIKRKINIRCRRGLVWKEQGKKTRQLIRKLTQLTPPGGEVHDSQSIYRFYRGEFSKGLQVWKNFIKENPDSSRSRYNYGIWLFRTGSVKLAADTMMEAISLYGKELLLDERAYTILLHAGRREVLQAAINTMVKRRPDHWNVCSAAAVALARSGGDIIEADRLSGHALKLQPNNPFCYFRSGEVLFYTGRQEEAIDLMQKGFQLLPEDDSGVHSTEAAWLLSHIFEDLGYCNSAHVSTQEVLERARRLNEFMPALACYWQAKALHKLNDGSAAISAINRALALQVFYPQRQELRTILKELDQ